MVKNKIDIIIPQDIVETLSEKSDGFSKPIIHPLTQDFGREDINALRDKINEVIKHR